MSFLFLLVYFICMFFIGTFLLLQVYFKNFCWNFNKFVWYWEKAYLAKVLLGAASAMNENLSKVKLSFTAISSYKK